MKNKNMVEFSEIKIGECFSENGEAYIKISEHSALPYNSSVIFSDDVKVRRHGTGIIGEKQ